MPQSRATVSPALRSCHAISRYAPGFCFKVKTFPEIVILPLRLVCCGFGATEKFAVPPPLLPVPPVTVIQLTLVDTCQGQPAALVETVMSKVPPLPLILPAVAPIVTVQLGGIAASCD